MICLLTGTSYITPVFHGLHWLPIDFGMNIKGFILTSHISCALDFGKFAECVSSCCAMLAAIIPMCKMYFLSFQFILVAQTSYFLLTAFYPWKKVF